MAKWVAGEIEAGVHSTLALEHPLTAKAIGLAAENGDELAIAALARSGEYIGRAVADFLHIFNPSAIIIGGGVSRTGHFLMDPMSTAMKANVISPYYLENLTLTTAALGDNAGLMGALALARSLSEGVASLVQRNHQP
jgi:glucokinase